VVAAPAGTLNPEIPPYFNRILMQLLAKNPRDRFRTACRQKAPPRGPPIFFDVDALAS
jgi:hypothetical protein